jgi:hypothetical protein
MVFFVKLRALVSSWQKEIKLNSYEINHHGIKGDSGEHDAFPGTHDVPSVQ